MAIYRMEVFIMDKEVENNNEKEIIEIEKVQENKQEEKKQESKQETKQEDNQKPKNRKGFCIAALVLGIVSLVLFCVWYISIPCGILAVIFGILGIKSPDKGMAIAGLVTGSITLSIIAIIISWLITIAIMFGFCGEFDDVLYDKEYNSYHYDDEYDLYQ